jgi:hypothetical protein
VEGLGHVGDRRHEQVYRDRIERRDSDEDDKKAEATVGQASDWCLSGFPRLLEDRALLWNQAFIRA